MTEMCGVQILLTTEILMTKFLGQSKGISIATRFTMTKLGPISVVRKPALNNSKVLLT
jgi:hypothetical protein